MRIIYPLVFGFIFCFLSTSLLASDLNIQVGTGVEFLGQNFNTHNQAYGIGGEIGVGYGLDPEWSLWLFGEFYDYPEYDSPFSSEERVASQFYESSMSLRYTFKSDVLSPYFQTGLGFFVENSGIPQAVYNGPFNLHPLDTSFVLEEGFGVQFKVSENLNLFIESKINIIFQSLQDDQGTQSTTVSSFTAVDYPINVGVILKL